MDTKTVLNFFSNQYVKSRNRFEKYFSGFDEQLKRFNADYLEIVSAVISGEGDKLNLIGNMVYIHATLNEQDNMRYMLNFKVGH